MRTYKPEVERWRPIVARELRAVGLESDLDKALWCMTYESGGNPEARGDWDPARGIYAAYGLYQIQSDVNFPGRPTGAQLLDPVFNIRYAIQMVKQAGSWRDWGENNLYQGKPFGALALNPYPGPEPSPPAPVTDDARLAALTADVALLVAVVAGNGARAKDGTVLTGRAALADQAQRGNSLALGLTLTQENLQALAGQVIALARNPSVNGVSRAETVAGLEAVAAGIQTLIDSFSEAKG